MTLRPVARSFMVERSSSIPGGITPRKLDGIDGIDSPLRRRDRAWVI
jgi:hypothetical protein